MKFAHSEHVRNSFVRCQRDDMAQLISHPANMADGSAWFLKAWRTHRGLTLQALAEAAGTSRGYVSDLERGARPIPPGVMLEKLATALDVEARQLVAEDPSGAPRTRTVKLVGYVGAGSQAHYYADADDPGEVVDAPENATDHTVAAEVRGTSLGPAFDRWLVYYDEVRSPVTPDLYNQLCVVGAGDQVLVKILRPAGDPNRFHLISNGSEEPIFDREVTWAARVKNMRPR